VPTVLGTDATKKENKVTESANEFVLTRLIDAPRENLFRCWTEPALLKRSPHCPSRLPPQKSICASAVPTAS
jgi:hypothetical protein